MNYYVGEIIAFAGNFIPKNFMLCDGSLININDYTQLYSVIGNTYGGNVSQFALPNLQGLVVVGTGQKSGGSNYQLGVTGGENEITLDVTNMFNHSHTMVAMNTSATTGDPTNNYLAASIPGSNSSYQDVQAYAGGINATPVSPNTTLDPATVLPNSGGQPHNNIQPSLTIAYIICVLGITPN